MALGAALSAENVFSGSMKRENILLEVMKNIDTPKNTNEDTYYKIK